MTGRSASDRALFEAELRRRNTEGLKLAALIGYTLVPSFWLLDILVLPAHKWKLAILRAALAGYALALRASIAWRPSFAVRWSVALSQSLALAVAWSVFLMVFLHEGFSSPYYAGVTLVIMVTGFVFDWPLRAAVAFHALVILPYVVPAALRLLPIEDPLLYCTHLVFLLSAMAIVFGSQRYRLALVEREFFANRELRGTKASLEDALQRLEDLDRAKSDFFNNITHELRTPLTLILATVEGLFAEPDRAASAQEADLRRIWRNALVLLRLINDLLDLARADERFLRLRLERNDLHQLLASIVEHSRPLAQRKRITLDLDLGPDPADLHVDPDRIERVVLNLLANALKFTEEGGRVTIRRRAVGEEVHIEVEDTGVGIQPDALGRIFERFKQADGSVTRRYGGTGIGLSFARELVELHGGSIDVRSEVGRGSVFTVRLKIGTGHFVAELTDRRAQPRDVADPRRIDDVGPVEWNRELEERTDYRFIGISEATLPDAAPVEPNGRRRGTVLVVDDNADVRQLIRDALEERWEVAAASDGLEGRDLASRLLPDLIVTDYMMPGMDGLALLRELRSDPRTEHIPVVMLTARGAVADRVRARESGADGYLSKPFSRRELRSVVARLVERGRQQAEQALRSEIAGLELVTAGLAHEIHNPLGNLKNAYVLIEEETARLVDALAAANLVPAQREEKVARARARIDRMSEVAATGIARIEEVVELVRRYSRDGCPRLPVQVDVNAAARDVVGVVTAGALHPARVELDLVPGEALARVIADEFNLVIRNLVRNAMDAAGPEGTVWVRTRGRDGGVVLEIADDGPGIEPQHLSRIFSPFFTTKAPGAGMGLGLSIAWTAVTRAGGTIEVESEPGHGATFRVWLPPETEVAAT